MKPLRLSFSDLGRQMVQTLVQHLQSPLFLTYILFLLSFWSMLLCQYLKDTYFDNVRNQTMLKKNILNYCLATVITGQLCKCQQNLAKSSSSL